MEVVQLVHTRFFFPLCAIFFGKWAIQFTLTNSTYIGIDSLNLIRSFVSTTLVGKLLHYREDGLHFFMESINFIINLLWDENFLCESSRWIIQKKTYRLFLSKLKVRTENRNPSVGTFDRGRVDQQQLHLIVVEMCWIKIH